MKLAFKVVFEGRKSWNRVFKKSAGEFQCSVRRFIRGRATLAIREPNARIHSLRGSQPSLIRPKWKRFRITSLNVWDRMVAMKQKGLPPSLLDKPLNRLRER